MGTTGNLEILKMMGVRFFPKWNRKVTSPKRRRINLRSFWAMLFHIFTIKTIQTWPTNTFLIYWAFPFTGHSHGLAAPPRHGQVASIGAGNELSSHRGLCKSKTGVQHSTSPVNQKIIRKYLESSMEAIKTLFGHFWVILMWIYGKDNKKQQFHGFQIFGRAHYSQSQSDLSLETIGHSK